VTDIYYLSIMSNEIRPGAESQHTSIPSKVASALRESAGHSKETLLNPTQEELIAREKRLSDHRTGDPRNLPTQAPLSVTTQSNVKLDPSNPMLATEWHGRKDIRMAMRARPCVTDPCDVIVRVTSTTICGSDTHMYCNEIPGAAVMKAGDIPGHECMGIIEDVGPEVKNLRKGDRVVVSAVISCGKCSYCREGRTSLCDTTNPSGQMEYLYGHRTAGLLGYSHLTGGYSGGQAEVVRVPFGEFNCIKVPNNLTDQQVLLLSDVVCTGFHGCEVAEVREGDVVVVFGAGPVGMMAAYLALRLRKAARVIIVDCIPSRLRMAQRLGIETLNFDHIDDDVVKEVNRRIPGGVDRTIECVGYRFPQGWLHKFMRATKLESDSCEIIRAMVSMTKKGGNMGIIGDYFGDTNMFPLGQLMEKNITFRGGQLFAHKYWNFLLSKIEDGTIDVTPWFTHVVPLEECSEAYKLFDEKEDGVMKIQLLTKFGAAQTQNANLQIQSLASSASTSTSNLK
jgi:threonine dehydrogenase-like Zn-dependent dehydrogenase